jgi:GWxTD domain-containing protein
MAAGWSVRGVVVAGVAILAIAAARGQVESSEDRTALPQALFLDAISVAGSVRDESRVDVFVQMNYEGLSFIKRGNTYDASYEITITVTDSSGAMVGEKSWIEVIKGILFEQSVASSAYSIVQRVFQVKPGLHRITVAVLDLETKITRRIERQIPVQTYWRHGFALSDVLLLAKVVEKGDKRSIQPQVPLNIGNLPPPVNLFFEVYNPHGLDSVRFMMSALTLKGDLAYSQDTVVSLARGRNDQILRFNHSTIPLGDYRLVVQAFARRTGDSAEIAIANTSRAIMIRWWGLPRSVKDLDLAIDQLRYIAKEGEMGQMQDAKTEEEKQAKFLEFWKRRDPNPNTPRNEKMELFYARVDYANRHFSHYREGWRTDMGMIYIIFGPPSDVSRHPFEVDTKPYEVWRYYDMNYEFVFQDESGFGDYRLLNPLYEMRKRSSEW